MPVIHKRLVVIGLWVLSCTATVFAQGADHGTPSWSRTPEDRQKYYAHRVDRYMEQLTKAYQLDNAQQTQVRTRLQQLQAEEEAYAAPLRQEFDAASREWQEMRKQRHSGQQIDMQRYEQLRTRMRQMWQNSPLMNPERVVSSVEQMLPAEQVRKGRKRREQMLGDLGRTSREHSRSHSDAGRSRERGTEPETPPMETPSVDRWKQYVDDFSRKYQLDSSQKSTADSLLRSAIEQRDSYERSHEADYAAARAAQDPAERVQRLKSLNETVRGYFEQLKNGLERIPTMAQRQAVEPPAPQSQPSSTSREHRSRSHGASRR